MGRSYKAIVSWSDLFFFCELDENIVIILTGGRENLHAIHLFYYEMALPQNNQWIYCFIEVL